MDIPIRDIHAMRCDAMRHEDIHSTSYCQSIEEKDANPNRTLDAMRWNPTNDERYSPAKPDVRTLLIALAAIDSTAPRCRCRIMSLNISLVGLSKWLMINQFHNFNLLVYLSGWRLSLFGRTR